MLCGDHSMRSCRAGAAAGAAGRGPVRGGGSGGCLSVQRAQQAEVCGRAGGSGTCRRAAGVGGGVWGGGGGKAARMGQRSMLNAAVQAPQQAPP